MFTCYIKLTNFCNVGCDFCYLPESSRAEKAIMDDQTIKRSVRLAEASAKSAGYKGVLYVIHGGEPLTISPNRLQQKLQLLLNESRIETALTLQTSLIPYRTEFRGVISKYFDSFIGSSIDFSGRSVSGSATGYIDLWLKKLNAARKDGNSVTPIVVPSRNELGKAREVVDFMVENDLQSFNIERYNSFTSHDDNRPTNGEHSQFLIDLTNEILTRHESGVFLAVNVVVAAIKGVLRSEPGDRWGGSCTRSFLVINPDGETNFCPDKIEYSESFGSVHSNPVDIIASDERVRVQTQHTLFHSNAYCNSCDFNSWCKTGCPITSNKPDVDGDCSGYKTYLNWLKNQDNKVLYSYLEALKFAQRGLLSLEGAV